MDDLSFYKSLYERELSRKNDLDNAINIPFSTMTILAGLIYYILSDIKTINENWYILLIFLVIISFLLTFTSVFFISKSYNNLFSGFKYLNFPSTIELRNYQKELNQFNSKSSEIYPFTDYLIECYVKYADHNIKINDKRGLFLFRAKRLIITAMFILLSTLCLFLILKFII